MQKEQIKFAENDIFEGMPSISAVIKSIEGGRSARKIMKVYIDNAKRRQKAKEIGFLTAKSHALSFDIEFVAVEEIEALAVGNTHGGIIAICTPRELTALSDAVIEGDGVYYILDGIEDPYNFGNAVRSLYASGADGIIVGKRNWLGVSGTVARASAGTSELIDVFVSDIEEAVKMFKRQGYTVICAGIRDSESLFEADLSKPLLVILGGEKRGISRSVLDLSDKIVRIDYGTDNFRGSLSASASAAVFGFEILRYNKQSGK